jgi:hypothetical protein
VNYFLLLSSVRLLVRNSLVEFDKLSNLYVQSKTFSKRGLKRVRKGILSSNGGLNASSESEEEEEHNGGMYLGSFAATENPEEKKRRQNRTKRFDRSKDLSRGGKGSGRGRGGGSASQRRATALQLAQNSADGQNGRAVEDIDWDSLTVRGTCQEVEKRYLRLTSAPDPHTVGETLFLLSK